MCALRADKRSEACGRVTWGRETSDSRMRSMPNRDRAVLLVRMWCGEDLAPLFSCISISWIGADARQRYCEPQFLH